MRLTELMTSQATCRSVTLARATATNMVTGAAHTRKHLSSKNGCAPGSNGLFSNRKKNGNYVAESRDEFEETPFHATYKFMRFHRSWFITSSGNFFSISKNYQLVYTL